MVRPKSISLEQAVCDLTTSLCDIPAYGQMVKIVVEHGDFWLYFCDNNNPHEMKIVYPKAKRKGEA